MASHLTADELVILTHLANDGRDVYAKGFLDHKDALADLRSGHEGAAQIARFATTANINLATTALTAIDGVTPVAGDVALVKNQSTASQNGLYLVSAGAWTRLLNSDGTVDTVKSGMLVSVVSGTANVGTMWTSGATSTTWSQVTVSGVSSANLASNANGLGASLVGIEDAATLITATTVEGALAELVKYFPLNLADPGTAQAIAVTRSAYVGITIGSAGAETNTLAIPTFLGQVMMLNADTVGTGTRAVTSAQAINQAGNTVMTFAQARDCIVLRSIKVGGAFRWMVAANDGVALS